jgi:hypothetical protein
LHAQRRTRGKWRSRPRHAWQPCLANMCYTRGHATPFSRMLPVPGVQTCNKQLFVPAMAPLSRSIGAGSAAAAQALLRGTGQAAARCRCSPSALCAFPCVPVQARRVHQPVTRAHQEQQTQLQLYWPQRQPRRQHPGCALQLALYFFTPALTPPAVLGGELLRARLHWVRKGSEFWSGLGQRCRRTSAAGLQGAPDRHVRTAHRGFRTASIPPAYPLPLRWCQ